jgi:hypothetical protein
MLDASELFSERFYLSVNVDVATAVTDGRFESGFDHFLEHGQFEGRKPSAFFDEAFYRAMNPDVNAAISPDKFDSGFAHFIEYGQFEQRDPIAQFDTSFYLASNRDVKADVDIDKITGFQHFIENGQFERRNPSADFDTSFYFQQNQDVAVAIQTGTVTSIFEHYIQIGIAQGRPGKSVTPTTPPVFDPLTMYVSNNGTNNAGELDKVNQNFQKQSTFNAGNNEGVELDRLGNLYHAGDATTGSLRVISQIADRGNGEAYNTRQDRELSGPLTGLLNPKGIAIAQNAGFTIIADNGTGDLRVFGTTAGGNVAPVAVTALPAKPWDVAYDETSDRLFVALVDGTVSVFDNYIGNGRNIGAGASRRITLTDAGGNKVSTNLHGIVYEPTLNKLVVTDVGAATSAQSANFNVDGRIYVIDNASTANGNIIPSRTIEGSATQLGNPVDMILDGTDVRIAEKAKDLLIVYRNIFNGPSGNIAPDFVAAETKPESLVAETGRLNNPDITDIESTATVINSIVTTSNPASAGSLDVVGRLNTNLQLQQTSFNTANGVASVESIAFDGAGDGFITFDSNDTNGGILVVNRLAKGRNGDQVNFSRDRVITGSNTGLVAPKGLDVADSLGLVFIAENNSTTPGILAFSTQAAGNVAPVWSTTNLGGRRPWDVDYDPGSDRMFVAATDGTVLIYDRYSVNRGAGGPTRVITPTDSSGAKISVNLHGIIYVAASNTLLLSDVGSAMDATDGQLFVINNAATANGNVPVRTQIGGDLTMLGNPVDITFDGANLYVAEKSNDVILRYDNILNRPGTFNVAADVMTTRNKPESVALVPNYLLG